MLGLFFSLILHELSHSLVARQFGLNVGGITLFLFGGVAELEHEPVSAKSEFWIAIAGPIMSFLLAGLAFVILQFFGDQTGSGPVAAVIGYLGLINVVLAIFNLIPAFPLDGGRVLRALVWHFSGDLLKATRIASRLGTYFAYFLIGVGVVSLFSDFGIGGLWQVLIGFFILAASKSSYQQLLIKRSLSGMSVAELMTKNPLTADANTSMRDAVDQLMLRYNVSFVPVVQGDRLLGYVDTGNIQNNESSNWATTHLSDILTPIDDSNSISIDVSLDELFDRIAHSGQRKFLVVEDGVLLGVITLSDMLRFLALKQGLGVNEMPIRSRGTAGLNNP
jgi:Zn-dependent protease/predicted transcriptional regulator